MNWNMTGTSKRRRTTTKTRIVHKCNQEEYLKRVNMVLFGNGHPEDGLAFLVRAFIKNQTDVQEDIAHIRNEVMDLGKKHDTTRRALEKYQAEEKGFDAGIKEAEGKIRSDKTEYRADFLKNLQTISVIVGIIVALFTVYFGVKKISSGIKNLGVPVTVTRSGKLYALPDTVSIKMFNLNTIDTTSNDTIK